MNKLQHSNRYIAHLSGLARVTSELNAQAVLRAHPDDFIVEEMLGFDLTGEGEHLCFYIEKAQLNTSAVINRIKERVGVKSRDIGYCGLKDKHALTRQWISVNTAGNPAVEALESLGEGVSILRRVRHIKKLRVGSHKGNAFTLVLRDFSGDAVSLESHLQRIQQEGFPNYFGEQRFGHDAQNIVRAVNLFAADKAEQPSFNKDERRRPKFATRDRLKRSLYLSACRSFLFNCILNERVRQRDWLQPHPDERFLLDGSNSFFQADFDSVLQSRLSSHDVHTSGALWGVGAQISEWERECTKSYGELTQLLEKEGMKASRRALRASVSSVSSCWNDDTTLVLKFSLPTGSYATSLLRELCFYRNAQAR